MLITGSLARNPYPPSFDLEPIVNKPQMPEQETTRIDALDKYEILDTPREAVFDDIAQLAAQLRVSCEPHIRFYAGVPLITPAVRPLALCA